MERQTVLEVIECSREHPHRAFREGEGSFQSSVVVGIGLWFLFVHSLGAGATYTGVLYVQYTVYGVYQHAKDSIGSRLCCVSIGQEVATRHNERDEDDRVGFIGKKERTDDGDKDDSTACRSSPKLWTPQRHSLLASSTIIEPLFVFQFPFIIWPTLE